MRRMRFSPRSSFARTLLLIVTLLFASLVTTYLVVLNFAILPSLQQFNKVLAYEVRMLMTDKLQLEDGTQLVVPPAFRREIYRELGISLYSNEAAEEAGLRWAQHYEFLSHQMAQQLGGPTEVRVEVNKSSPVVWLKTYYGGFGNLRMRHQRRLNLCRPQTVTGDIRLLDSRLLCC